MNVVSSGAKYMIYDDYVMTYRELPAKTFRAAFNKMTGPYLVETPNLSIKEIAYTVGYENQLDFSQIFRKNVGCSPSTYRCNKHTPAL